MTPIWPLTSWSKPEVKVEYLCKKIISQQPQEVNCTIFAPLYRSLIEIKTFIFTKKWPQFDLYFLIQTGSQSLIFKKSYLNNRKR